MNRFTRTSAAVIVAALGLGALAPAAMSHDWGRQQAGNGPRHEMMFRGDQHPMGGAMAMRGGFLEFNCSAKGAERLERAFVSLARMLQPTAEQQPLFDALKTAALTAQTSLADTCAAARPADSAAAAPGLVERLQTRLKLDEARTAALSGVLPELEAFYNSLTDAQKARLDAPREMRRQFGTRDGGERGLRFFFRHHGPMTGQGG